MRILYSSLLCVVLCKYKLPRRPWTCHVHSFPLCCQMKPFFLCLYSGYWWRGLGWYHQQQQKLPGVSESITRGLMPDWLCQSQLKSRSHTRSHSSSPSLYKLLQLSRSNERTVDFTSCSLYACSSLNWCLVSSFMGWRSWWSLMQQGYIYYICTLQQNMKANLIRLDYSSPKEDVFQWNSVNV